MLHNRRQGQGMEGIGEEHTSQSCGSGMASLKKSIKLRPEEPAGIMQVRKQRRRTM